MVIQRVLMIGPSKEQVGRDPVEVHYARQIAKALLPPLGGVDLLAEDLFAKALPGTLGDIRCRIHAATDADAAASYKSPSEVVNWATLAGTQSFEAINPVFAHVMDDVGIALRQLTWGYRLAALLASSQHIVCFESDAATAHVVPFALRAALTNDSARFPRRVLLVGWSADSELFQLISRGRISRGRMSRFVRCLKTGERFPDAAYWLANGKDPHQD